MTELPKLDDGTLLAVERTRLGHDRTLLAWVRTSVSLISFGFTIYKFFEYLREAQANGEQRVTGPRHFALVMILAGLITLILAAVQNRIDLARLERRYGPQPGSLVGVLAFVVGGVGIVGLAMVYFQR